MQRLTAFLTKNGKEYIAVCPELELKTHGDSADEALDHLWEGMEEYLASLSLRRSGYIEGVSPEEVEVDFLGWKN
jgi:predicted RNase H-like HicB family nuclease